MSNPNNIQSPQVDEKSMLANNTNTQPSTSINEKQPSEDNVFNEKLNSSPESLNTVENVVKQQGLGTRPSPQQDLPFDFNRFLEQMKDRRAEPIGRFVKSFQREFERKPWAINEQIRIVQDFLDFSSVKMRECEVWCDVTEQEFENAKEGMEKLVMNRLFSLTFAPAIKGPVTTDDRERDEILHQKIQIFRWIREEHLDIPVTKHNESFLEFAIKELLKINAYKAPRDKLICILNCCKVIFGLIRQVDGEEGADKFLPVLIFVVLRANPDHLVSNVQYISRFRNPEKLLSEAGYYLSSLMGAIAFIENMDVLSLSITQEDFDKNIEITMKELERERPQPQENDTIISYDNVMHPSKSSQPAQKSPIINPAQAKALFENGKSVVQRTIQKPLTVVGKFISDMTNDTTELGTHGVSSILDVFSSSQSSSRSTSPHRPPSINEPPPLQPRTNLESGETNSRRPRPRSSSISSHSSHTSQASNDFSDLQVEVARASTADYQSSLTTLKAIFPNMDAEVCEIVLHASNGGLSKAIDSLLEISDPSATGGRTVTEQQSADDVQTVIEQPKNEVSAVH